MKDDDLDGNVEVYEVPDCTTVDWNGVIGRRKRRVCLLGVYPSVVMLPNILGSILFGLLTLVLTTQAKQLQGLSNHKYTRGEKIELYASKVGPYDNLSETYRYYSFPFCPAPKGKVKAFGGLGEFLEGDRFVRTPYEMTFGDNIEFKVACQKSLEKEDVEKFRSAVENEYYYQMFFDDLPIWGFIGIVEDDTTFLYTHIHFNIVYHDDRVIGLNLSTDPKTRITIDKDTETLSLQFTYSVKWSSTDIPFEQRLDVYAKDSLLPQNLEIHWFSIINSCVTVLLLTGFLSTILMRVLKNDFIKFTRDDELGEEQEESGWKYLHGDVFRFPRPLTLFCAMMGTGMQFLVIASFIFCLATFDLFYPYNRGTLQTSTVVLYALTSGIAGFTAASWYKMMGGTQWVHNILLTCALFMGPLLLLFSFLNSVALSYNSTQALPFGTIMTFILLWSLITFPLTVIGGIMGKNTKEIFKASCRTTKYPREIPPLPWYRQTVPQMAMAGFLPFSAIYIELYYIFASIWGHKIYVIWSILVIVFVILIVVTAFITVALTYFQLTAEDHRWWWRSFLCGGSTGFFMFVYCFYFYFQKSEMSGLLQTTFFFGYMGVVCYAMFLMLGNVGFRASLLFVRQIYKAIKCE